MHSNTHDCITSLTPTYTHASLLQTPSHHHTTPNTHTPTSRMITHTHMHTLCLMSSPELEKRLDELSSTRADLAKANQKVIDICLNIFIRQDAWPTTILVKRVSVIGYVHE